MPHTFLSVDGTDMKIEEQKKLNPKWISHKLKGTAIRCEMGIYCGSGGIVWLNGPFPVGSHPDNKIVRTDLKHRLIQNELLIADDGYTYSQTINKEDAVELGNYHSHIFARHETVNTRNKRFRVMD